ncbi:aminotransferase class I/II-fold pyridoxal phosphate-dependent enzyme [Paraglaciecola sp. 2405UD69-4]|uniref:aminotransferase class I/II-fold pyridoxal phosphate-dependent enzyme n=1 Tax=Paraglaciecola sp. 2405UD69-4 TaxID=3391836 RepID=UPI0039C9CC67
MAFKFITEAMTARLQDGLYRKREVVEAATGPLIQVGGKHYINFSSNDYLGMRRSSVVMQAWADGLAEFGAGSGASPLVTGYTSAHQALEVYLAERLNRDRVLLFNSGFSANQAICQALFGHSNSKAADTIISDKLMHASFIEGAQGVNATLTRFKHNSISHLKTLLAKANTENTLVATEGVFSMDGDQAPLISIVPLIDNHSAWLMVDDAHGFGTLGKTGLGVVEKLDLSQQQIPILMGTFGKAVGTAGAFIAASEELIEYLINFSRHYIYSTAMPAAQAYATLMSLQAKLADERRQILKTRITLFKELARSAGLTLMPSDTAIQPVLIGEPQKALAASERLKNLGLWVSAIRYPTVPKHTDRLRITISASHDERDIQALVDGLQLCLLG